MIEVLKCPACHAPLDYSGDRNPTIRCPFCGTTVILPESLQAKSKNIGEEELPNWEDIIRSSPPFPTRSPELQGEVAPLVKAPPKPRQDSTTVVLGILAFILFLTVIVPIGYNIWSGLQPCAWLDVRLGRPSGCLRILEENDFVTSVAFSPDGNTLASGGAGNRIFLWRLSNGSLVRTIKLPGRPPGRVAGVAFSPDGTMLASGDGEMRVQLWGVADGQLIRTLERVHAWYVEVAFSPNWTTLVGASGKQVGLVRVADGSFIRLMEGHTADVNCVAFSPDGTIVASGASDLTARLWRVADGTLLQTLGGHTKGVRSTAFSPDGTILATGANDNRIRLWRVADGVLLHTLEGHTDAQMGLGSLIFHLDAGGVTSVAFSPDGTMLASGGWDNTVRLWQVNEGKYLRTLNGHTNMVTYVAFSPDGKLLASGSGDDTVRLWRVQP